MLNIPTTGLSAAQDPNTGTSTGTGTHSKKSRRPTATSNRASSIIHDIKINQNLNNCDLNFKEELEWLQNKCSKANTNDINSNIDRILDTPIKQVSGITEANVSQFLDRKIFSPSENIISLLYEEDFDLQILSENRLTSKESGISSMNLVPDYIVQTDSNIFITIELKNQILSWT